MIAFFAAGTPKAQPRGRAVVRPKKGGGVRAGIHNPDTADAWKRQVMLEAQKHRTATPFDGPVRVGLTFYFERPTAHFSRKTGTTVLKLGAPEYHRGRPDCDNLAKAVLDALTDLGGYWSDDAAVSWLSVRKVYAAPGAPVGCMIQIKPATP